MFESVSRPVFVSQIFNDSGHDGNNNDGKYYDGEILSDYGNIAEVITSENKDPYPCDACCDIVD